ncbi:MAG TPA: LamG domain-containing protein, partial [Sedimentisphaerales bacterium]|nr:LamG domain-containing protein [Sedimentisphaerales bacterium]
MNDYFSFFGSGGIDWQALHDPNNNPILVACLKGSADESLKSLGILDVQQRLERLERGNLIKKAGERYTLAFPAVVGDKRFRLQKYAEQAARQLVPFGEKMIAQIRVNLAGRDEMLYHVLWSVVMDGGSAWDAARVEMNKKIEAGDTSTENKAWLLYPSHPFRVGTNGYDTSCGHLKITWSRNTLSPNVIGRVISQYSNQLSQAIEQDHAVESADVKDALGKYGLVDEAGKVCFYTIQSDSDTAAVYKKLGTEFGRQMMANLDVNKVAEMLEVSPGIAFVIAYHEICWQLLQDLAGKKVLAVPRIVAKAGTEASEAYQLVSLAMGPRAEYPFLETEISKEESQAIEDFKKTKSEILQDRKFSNQSTATNAFLTLISAYHHQDQDTLEQIFPIVKQKEFERLSSPETRSQILAVVRKSIFCRIEIENTSPEESDICAIYTSESPEKTIDQVWSFAYVEGAWRFAGSTSDIHNWSAQAKQAEALTRNILRSEAEKTEALTTNTLQQDAGGQDDSEVVQGAPEPDKSTINRVLSLDGEGDHVRIADSQSLRSFSDAITIEVWVKASSYAEYGDINSIIRKNIAGGAENFLLRFRNIDGNPWIQMSLSGIGILRAQHEFTLGKWYHLAGTYDGSSITVLVNGVAIESEKFSGPMYIDKSDLFIGKGDPEFRTGEFFDGVLDEIRIWNVARSQEEIRAAMNAPLTGKEEGLVVYLNFDNGTAKDQSGHGNDGFLNADAQIVESPRSASQAVQGEEKNKLVAWWKLDETDVNEVADSSGNNYQGTLIGNPQWRPAGGKIGGALEFDGDGDYVEIGNESAFDIAGAITVAAWIRVNVFDKRWQTIVAKGDTSWRLQRTAEEDTLAFHCTGIVSVEGQWPEGIEGNKNVNDGKWHHVVGVYDGAKVSLYIDGVPDKSSEASGAIQMNDSAVIIGGNSEQTGREWNGLIDEVSIIGGAIDANAIHALYTGADPNTIAQRANPQLQSPDKLVAWWKFDNDANDSAGANHGTIHGNPAYMDGMVGRAIIFDVDDYVDCGNPDSLNFGTGDWTVSAWIKTTQSGTEPENRGTVFANGGDEEGGIRYALAVNEEYLGTAVLTTDTDTYKVQAIGKTAVNDGTWHHVVGTRSEGQLRVYVDGVLDGGNYLSAEYDLSGASQHNAYIGVITDNRDGSLYKYFVGL